VRYRSVLEEPVALPDKREDDVGNLAVEVADEDLNLCAATDDRLIGRAAPHVSDHGPRDGMRRRTAAHQRCSEEQESHRSVGHGPTSRLRLRIRPMSAQVAWSQQLGSSSNRSKTLPAERTR